MKLLGKSRTILVTLVMSIVFLLAFSSAAFAADAKLSASSETGYVDDEVTVTISIENALGTEGGEFVLTYDPDLLKPTKLDEGAFVTAAQSDMLDFNLNYANNKIKVLWITPYGDTASSGVVCTITFELLAEGESTLVFSDIVFAPDDVDAAAPVSGKVTVEDPVDAKEKAIKDADDTICTLPDPADITLADKAAVAAARAKVDKAKQDHGAVDADFTKLDKLVAAEKQIAKLEAIKAADDAIYALPSLEKLTLDDEADVLAARALVNKAKKDHGAVDGDFVYLSRLVSLENRIKELKGLVPPPPTGGLDYMIPAGLLLVFMAGLLLFIRHSRLGSKVN